MMVTEKAHSIPFAQPDASTIAAFSSPAWAASLFSDSSLHPIATLTRVRTDNETNRLISRTLATPTTITAWQTFWAPPSPQYPRGQVQAMLRFAADVSGHPATLHGGIVAVVLDEMMNYISAAYLSPGMAAFTVEMKVKFRRPVTLPSVVLVRTWIEEKSQGKKLYVRGRLEDGEGGVYAEGENLFLEIGNHGKAKI